MSFLDQIMNNVKGAFGMNAPAKPTFKQAVSNVKTSKPAPAPVSNYDQTMARLDRLQSQLNPYINQANKNASMIDNYVTSHRYPSAGGSNIANGGINSIPQSGVGSYLSSQPVDTSADYLPVIQQLSDMIRQKHIGNPMPSVDLSPYLAQADQIKQQREAMG